VSRSSIDDRVSGPLAPVTPLRVLLVEDCAADAELILDALRRAGIDPQCETVETEREYLAHLSSDLDVILADYSLPGFDGLRALELARELRPDVPFIIVSGTMGEDNAVAAMKKGASDYLLKDRLARLGQAVCLARERKAHEAAALERHRLSAFAQDVGVAFTQSVTLASMLELSVQLIVLHMDAALARIWACNPHEDHLELLASAGRVASMGDPGRSAPVIVCTLDDIIRDRRPRMTNAVISDPRIDQAWAAANGIASFIGYPLIVGERVVGVIAMFGRVPFSAATGQAISYIANAVASAIERDRIQESQARLAAIVEATTDLVTIRMLDRSPFVCMNQTERAIMHINRAGRRMLGIGPLEPISNLSEFRTPAFVAEWNDVILPCALTNGQWSGETTYLSRDGRVIPVSQVMVAHATAGGKIQLSTIARDITERRLLEAQLRQAQKMDAVGQLAGGIAHDFNNLLTAILGYARFAADALAPGDQRRSDVDQVIKAAQRASGLTKRLLAFSRKQVLQPTNVDLNGLVTGVSQMLRLLIGEHIELEAVLAPDLALVRADAGQLEQIVINLAVNARDAMEQGGRLTLETANVRLHAASGLPGQTVVAGSYVMLAVIDGGVGMDESTKRHLFEPFFTTKEHGKGTGLGLATVYGIVKQSDGYIWVDSERGRGSAFRVYLPRSEYAVEAAAAPAESAAPRHGSETVLLVEDEDGVRELSRRMLENAGYHVLEAANARDAEMIFARSRDAIDLLVTDVVMPGASGPDLFRRLVGEKPGLKVIYVSGYATEAMARQFGLDRSAPYVQKPFTADQLASRVRSLLDECRLQSV
jgi:two-component system cell cycle sensor histidine kinase/response regulator CckA